MGGEWRETTLGNMVDFISGGTPSKEAPEYWGGSVPWVSAKDMKRFRIDDTEDHVTEHGLANGTKLVTAGTVLLLVRGMTLLNDLPICIANRPMTFNQDVKALRLKPGICDEFLPYLLLGNKARLLGLVDLAGHGTGRLNTDELKALAIVLPPEPEQRAIAYILGTLDDKIELNRRMNETLEAMARALFKSWFVDFDPARAKCRGTACRAPTMPQFIIDLFPDSFEDSELGQIPKGWKIGRLDHVLVFQRGFDLPSSARTSGVFPVIAASGPSGTHNEFMVRGPGVTTGRSGVLGNVYYVHEDFWPLNTSLWVKEFKNSTPAYAFHLLRRLDFKVFNAGSAVPTLNRNHIHGLSTLLPPPDLIRVFDATAVSSLKRQHVHEIESRTLVTLRDTLLPKLISGELRVKDAERIVGRHV